MSNPRPLHLPARVLTLDQAYAFAYGDLRRRLAAFGDLHCDRRTRGILTEEIEAAAELLERDLASLMLGGHLADCLARPE